MSKEEKEKKALEEQNESLADSKKIDLYINNQEDQEQGISIMNVFSRLKQRFHLYAFVMISTLLLGLLVPTMMYTFKDKKETAVAVLGFDYPGASEQQAPDGSALNIATLKSSYIIQNALDNVTLSKEVTTAQVQSNITITRPLTDETRREQEIINELKEAKNNGYADMVKDFTLRYREQYFITLKNGFSNGRSKVRLSSSDLSHLLSAIMTSYNDYFIEEYQDKSMPNNYLAAIDEADLDYLEILDDVSNSLNYLAEYCNNRSALLPDFKTKEGVSFADLSSVISTLQSVDIKYIYSYIYLNNVYKDKLVLQTYYEMQKRNAEFDLVEVNSNIDTVKTSISAYPEGEVVIQTTDAGGQVKVPSTDPEFNRLVLELTDLNASKSALEEQISLLTDRIAKLAGAPATDAQKAKANEYIQTALTDARGVYDLVSDSATQLFNSNAYKSKYMHALTTGESEKFSDSIKLFAIGAGAGLFLGVFVWIADAFILEFKAVKRANEAREAE